MSNITEIPNPERDEIAASLEQAARVWRLIADKADDIAVARRALFTAYCRQGFTEAQTLELCKALTL